LAKALARLIDTTTAMAVAAVIQPSLPRLSNY
jgi:hypothetical protein